MANVIKKTPGDNGTYHYLINVNISGYPSSDWEADPDVSGVSAVAQNYWKYNGTNIVIEMTQPEKDAVDVATSNEDIINTQEPPHIYNFTETFTASELKTITLPIPLVNASVYITDTSFTELSGETLLSASGSGPVGWDPGNRGNLEARINDGIFTNLVYNNTSQGSTAGYIIGIDMLTATTINQLMFIEHGTSYFNTSWEFIGTNVATAATYDVIESGTSSVPYLAANPYISSFSDQTYRYFGIRCVTSNNASFAILRELELSSGTTQTVERTLPELNNYIISKINDSTYEITNLKADVVTYNIMFIGKP